MKNFTKIKSLTLLKIKFQEVLLLFSNLSFKKFTLWLSNKIYEEQDHWPLWYVIFFIFGIAFYFRFLTIGCFPISLALLGATLIIFLFYRKYLLFIVLFFLLGINISIVRVKLLDTFSITPVLRNIEIKGYVKEFTKKPNKKSILILQNIKLNKAPYKVKKLRVVTKYMPKNLEVGSYISFRATIIPSKKAKKSQYDFVRHDFFREISGTAFVKSKIQILSEKASNSYINELNNLRHFIANRINHQIGNRVGGLASALIVGDKSLIYENDYENIRISGLSHMFAVSGLHLTLISIISFFAIRYTFSYFALISQKYNIKKFAAVIVLIAALFYLFITGLQISAIRAYIMISLVMLAVIFDLFADLKRSIACAAFIMLLFQPELALQPGFQLSFIATLALIAAYEIRYINEKKSQSFFQSKLIFYISNILYSTLIATFATSMFVIYHFHFISNYSLLANLLVNPIIGFLIMPFIIVFFILLPFNLEWLALIPIKFGLYLLIKITEYIGSMKYSTISKIDYSDLALFLFTLGVLWLCCWKRNLRYIGIPIILLSFFI